MIYKIERGTLVAPLFGEVSDTTIYSCLQGIMGELYADSQEAPTCAMALLGDYCFLAGEPSKELVLYRPESWNRAFHIVVPQNRKWEVLIEACYGEQAKRVIRYATKKEKDVFDAIHLKKITEGLPDGYVLQMMDEELFAKCRQTKWCKDWVANYPDYALYKEHGLGAVLLKDNEPVSGASSYSGYMDGIEIEIDTKEEYRRKGLAYICGAKLILECLKLGWYPSWDAAHKGSLALAQKLGYHFDHEYVAYEIGVSSH